MSLFFTVVDCWMRAADWLTASMEFPAQWNTLDYSPNPPIQLRRHHQRMFHDCVADTFNLNRSNQTNIFNDFPANQH